MPCHLVVVIYYSLGDAVRQLGTPFAKNWLTLIPGMQPPTLSENLGKTPAILLIFSAMRPARDTAIQ